MVDAQPHRPGYPRINASESSLENQRTIRNSPSRGGGNAHIVVNTIPPPADEARGCRSSPCGGSASTPSRNEWKTPQNVDGDPPGHFRRRAPPITGLALRVQSTPPGAGAVGQQREAPTRPTEKERRSSQPSRDGGNSLRHHLQARMHHALDTSVWLETALLARCPDSFIF